MIWNMHPLYPIQISRYLSISKLFRTVPIPPRWRLRHPRSKGPKGSCDWYILGRQKVVTCHDPICYEYMFFQKKLLLLKLIPCPTPYFLIEEKIKIKLPTRWGGIFVPCDTSKKWRTFIKVQAFFRREASWAKISRVSSTKRFNKMAQKSCLRLKKR